MEIATIGFTRSTAESFFRRIGRAGLPRLIDVRLNNSSQLAGFAKRQDLSYFLRELCGVEYVEEPLLTPDEAAFKAYRAKAMDWEAYATAYCDTLAERRVESLLQDEFQAGAVLLCSEAEPERCHRRIAAEYLAAHWGSVTIRHL